MQICGVGILTRIDGNGRQLMSLCMVHAVDDTFIARLYVLDSAEVTSVLSYMYLAFMLTLLNGRLNLFN